MGDGDTYYYHACQSGTDCGGATYPGNIYPYPGGTVSGGKTYKGYTNKGDEAFRQAPG